jgi:hypothetical protein
MEIKAIVITNIAEFKIEMAKKASRDLANKEKILGLGNRRKSRQLIKLDIHE